MYFSSIFMCFCFVFLHFGAFFGNKLLVNLCARLGLTLEYMLNKGGDDLSDSCGKQHSHLQCPKQYFSNINLSSSVANQNVCCT